MKKIVDFLISLKLTAVLLIFAIILVFVGTIAQADEGLYGAQARYFRHWIVVGIQMFGQKIPLILPGGYLIGTLLLVNLVATHIYRFELTWKKAGIQFAHAGLIILLVGQLSTDLLSRELHMRFSEGEARNYSDSATEYELAISCGDEITSIGDRTFSPGRIIQPPNLPFSILIKTNWHNSDINYRAPMLQNGPPLATNGIARNFDFKYANKTKTMDERNIPTVLIEFTTPSGSLGEWVASAWAGDPALVEAVRNGYTQMGASMAKRVADQLAAPQTLSVGGKAYSFVLRPLRAYHPYSITLLKATHSVYPGTDIPKDFRSRVQIDNPQAGEKREVEISMNNPLRYGGYTYYQYQMDAGQFAQQAGRTPSSTLSVVRNPSWLTPYVGCVMVAIGLLIQFMYHLVRFISRKKNS